MNLVQAAAVLSSFSANLSAQFIERHEEVSAIMGALVAEEHVFLFGPPGTAKSAVTNAMGAAFNAPTFGYLMTKYSQPEEIFGPYSIQGLTAGVYERKMDGYLPTATFAFLDEIFKSNSAILNALLTITNERTFRNGTTTHKAPLELLVGASNELPQDPSLEALFDRFLIRRSVGYIRDNDKLRDLLSGKSQKPTLQNVDREALAIVRQAAVNVSLDRVMDDLLKIREELGAVNISASDRRWVKIAGYIRARAAMAGRLEAQNGDLIHIVDCLWRRPEERPAILGIVARIAAPGTQQALAFLNAAKTSFATINFATIRSEKGGIEKVVSVNRELANALSEIDRLTNKYGSDASVAEIRREISTLKQKTAKEVSNLVGS